MKKLNLFLLLIFACITLTGCEKKIDASTSNSLKASIQEVSGSLPPARAPLFENAFIQMTTLKAMLAVQGRVSATGNTDGGRTGGIAEIMASQEKAKAEVIASVDGKTGEEVIALGEAAKKEMDDLIQRMAAENLAKTEN